MGGEIAPVGKLVAHHEIEVRPHDHTVVDKRPGERFAKTMDSALVDPIAQEKF